MGGSDATKGETRAASELDRFSLLWNPSTIDHEVPLSWRDRKKQFSSNWNTVISWTRNWLFFFFPFKETTNPPHRGTLNWLFQWMIRKKTFGFFPANSSSRSEHDQPTEQSATLQYQLQATRTWELIRHATSATRNTLSSRHCQKSNVLTYELVYKNVEKAAR